MFSFFFHYRIVLVTGAVFKCTNVLWTHCAWQKFFVLKRIANMWLAVVIY